MDAQQWVILAVVVVIVAVYLFLRFQRTQERTAQERRIDVQAQAQAQLPGDRISQREDRRVAGMTAEDLAWEQASLQRNRESEARTRPTWPDEQR